MKWVEKGAGPLNVTSAGGGEACDNGEVQQQWLPSSFCTSMTRSTDSPMFETGSFMPTLVPTSRVQVVPGTSAQLPRRECGDGG